MKDIADIETRLRAEVDVWFTRQCQNIYADFYLYYLPTTPEHDGGILICENPPVNQEYHLAIGERLSKDATKNQIFNWFRGVCRSLPILSY